MSAHAFRWCALATRYAMGQYLQDFMSASNLTQGEHLGNYLEEQTGRAPTQMNDFPLPAGHAEAWTEWFQATNFEPEQVGNQSFFDQLLPKFVWCCARLKACCCTTRNF